MSAISTAGLGLFDIAVAADRSVGAALRDAALAQVAQGRQTQIQRVRVALLAYLTMAGLKEFTGDDVLTVAIHLGYADEWTPGEPGRDTRWLAAVVKGWPEVTATDRFVPSTLPQRHCRPVRCWVRK